MSTDPETVAVELVAKLDNFDGRVRVSASAFGGAMKQVEQSANRAEGSVTAAMVKTSRSVQQAQQASRNLGYQISDISTQLAGGQSPFLILAQQGPQIANALEGAKGKVGQFAAFLSGPWGAALLGATTLLGVFGSKLFETGESVDALVEKMKKEAAEKERNRQATELYNNTLDGRIAKERELTGELERQLKSERELAREKLANAQGQLSGQRGSVSSLQQQVKDQEGLVEFVRGRLSGKVAFDPARPVQVTQASLKREEDRLKQLKDDLAKAQASVGRLEQDVRRAEIPILIADVAGKLDPLTKATQEHTDAMDALNRRRVAGTITAAEYTRETERLDKALRSATEAAHAASRTSASLPKVTGREVASILGTTINGGGDGSRSAAKNKAVGGAANSYHLSGQAIDIPLTVNGKPLTKAGIRAELEKAGIIIKELLGPGDKGHSDHFHIAFDKKRRGPDEVAAAQNKANDAATRAAEREIPRQQQVASANASLDQQILERKKGIAESAAAQAALAIQAIDQSEKYDLAQIDALVAEYKLSDGTRGISAADAEILKKKREQVAQLDREAIERDQQRRVRAENLAIATGLLDNSLELLHSEEDVATTQKERRRIALAIVDAEYAKLEATLKNAIAEGEAAGVSEKTLDVMRQRLANIQTLKANAIQGATEKTASPLESYTNEIRRTAGDIDNAFEEIAAGSLRSIVDGIGQAAAGFTSLGDVARSVLAEITAALVKLAIQQVILAALGDKVGGAVKEVTGAGQAAAAGGGAASAATIAQAAAVAAAWAPAAAMASLATLGANSGPAIGAIIATNAVALALSALGGVAAVKKAEGGPVFGPGTSTSDSIPAMLSNGEFVIRKKAVDGLGIPALNHMNRTGELPSVFADGGAVTAVRPNNTPATAPGGAGTFSADPAFKTMIAGALAEAAKLMPPVNLYPTLDPGAVLREALSSPGGRRATFEFLSQNSGRVRKSLNR